MKFLLDALLSTIGDGVITTDPLGKVTLINKAAEKLTGWSRAEALGKQVSQVLQLVNEKNRERCPDPVGKVLQAEKAIDLEECAILVARDGRERTIIASGTSIRDNHGNILGAMLVITDITERKKAEEQMIKAEKLESISLLAGGIAHDFNNYLMVIMGNISLAKRLVNPESKIFARLQEAEKASLQAKELTQQLLTFAKGGAPVKNIAAVGDLIKDTVEFVSSGSQTEYSISVASDLWPVNIDEGQMSQVISNLIINAEQAMPEGGMVEVKAVNTFITTQHKLPLPEGEYVKISIKDFGVGIAAENLTRIFDPYFTTKEQGTGLGLSTAYSIIKNHSGLIDVESAVGAGTIFNIYLPAYPKQTTCTRRNSDLLVTGQGKVLVMDDEEKIREMVGRMLNHLGYEACLVKDGQEAIHRYRQALEAENPYCLVILDLTIPGGPGGKEVVKKIIALDPKAKAIVSSGYSQDLILADYPQYGFSGVIVKPYKIEELSQVLHNVLKNKAN